MGNVVIFLSDFSFVSRIKYYHYQRYLLSDTGVEDSGALAMLTTQLGPRPSGIMCLGMWKLIPGQVDTGHIEVQLPQKPHKDM